MNVRLYGGGIIKIIAPLLSSGLMGPVTLQFSTTTTANLKK